MPTLFEQERVVADVMMAAASTPSFSGEGNWTEAGPNAHGSTVARSPLLPPGLIGEEDAHGSTVSVLFPPKARWHTNPEITAVETGTSLLAPSYTSVDLGQVVLPPAEEIHGSAHFIAPGEAVDGGVTPAGAEAPAVAETVPPAGRA